MWTTILTILKVAIPIIIQIVGLLQSMHGAVQAERAKSGQFSISQQALPVYGNIGMGLGLVGTGLAASHFIAHRDKSNAAAAPQVKPANVNAALHEMALELVASLESDAADDATLDRLWGQVKGWRGSHRGSSK